MVAHIRSIKCDAFFPPFGNYNIIITLSYVTQRERGPYRNFVIGIYIPIRDWYNNKYIRYNAEYFSSVICRYSLKPFKFILIHSYYNIYMILKYIQILS